MWLRFNSGKWQIMPNARVVNIYREMKSHQCAELAWQKLRLTIVARRHIFRAHSLIQPVLYSVLFVFVRVTFSTFLFTSMLISFSILPQSLCRISIEPYQRAQKATTYSLCERRKCGRIHHRKENIERTKYFCFFFDFSTSVFVRRESSAEPEVEKTNSVVAWTLVGVSSV